MSSYRGLNLLIARRHGDELPPRQRHWNAALKRPQAPFKPCTANCQRQTVIEEVSQASKMLNK